MTARIDQARLDDLKAKGLKILSGTMPTHPVPQQVTAQPAKPAFGKWGHKFHAKRVERGGRSFPSEAEAEFYSKLEREKAEGKIIFFLSQVPYHLPGGIKYVLDYMAFNSDGTCDLWEVKGFPTPEFKMKKKLVEANYPVKIRCVRYQKRKRMPSYFEEFEP